MVTKLGEDGVIAEAEVKQTSFLAVKLGRYLNEAPGPLRMVGVVKRCVLCFASDFGVDA